MLHSCQLKNVRMMLSCLCNVLLIQKQEKKNEDYQRGQFPLDVWTLGPWLYFANILLGSASSAVYNRVVTGRLQYLTRESLMIQFSILRNFWQEMWGDTAGEEEVVTWSRGQINYNRNTDSSVCFCSVLLVIRSTTFYIISISIITSW